MGRNARSSCRPPSPPTRLRRPRSTTARCSSASVADDTLTQMRSQVDEAYAAADRLVREAEAAARARPSEGPRAGYEGGRRSAERSAFGDRQARGGLLDAARTSVPPELARQLAEGAREL